MNMWFAIRLRSNFERLADANLRARGVESFLPLYRSVRRWPTRTRIVELPLFPGYLFCRFDSVERNQVLTAPGVIGVVGAGATPLPVDPAEIAAIRAISESRLFAQPWPFLRSGARIRLVEGPLSGVEGIVLETRNDLRLVVSVTLLQRSVAVEIERSWVQPLGKSAAGHTASRRAAAGE